ncbi:SDR family oxidoreductase [Deinococcus multiflagellatus]|uniref:SDR family oxidoreductase n=1 Tax=Deinococcus multiflagellatus TaxID=1656887 RepID=UPI001CCDBDB9|nr:SDR family oxidoreductase [Deinococcus multiflagellatus]MBZ9711933.1 SDR family oxidoreductase [Deinococcus multiflagellatus]
MIAVTGATGHLGRLTLDTLLRRGAPAQTLVALVRSPEKAADLAAQGVQVRRADYTQQETWPPALDGVSRLLLVSSNDLNDRPGQHRRVIEAAREAGVALLAYTSLLNAGTAQMGLAADHRATEDILRASGVPFTLLRNGWYTENYTGSLAQTLAQGVLLGAAGDGQVTPATRADYAEAAAAVLTGEGHGGATYELGGDEALTLSQIAAEFSRQGGRPVAYQNLPVTEFAQTLNSFGLPAPLAEMLADSDAGLARGELQTDSGDLRRLIGRPTTPLAAAVADALRPA